MTDITRFSVKYQVKLRETIIMVGHIMKPFIPHRDNFSRIIVASESLKHCEYII